MNLELSKDELAIIEEMLDKAVKTLPVEIHHTRTNEYKDMLKAKQKTVENLLNKIKAA